MKFSYSLGMLVAVALLTTAMTTEANGTGYLCKILHMPGPSTAGDYGWVGATVYTQPDCGGNYVGNIRRCSSGASLSSCASSNIYTGQSETNIVGTASMWQRASEEGTKIYYFTTNSCIGGGTNCFSYMYINYP